MQSQMRLRHGAGGHARSAGIPPLGDVQSAFRVRRPNDNEAVSWNFFDSAFYAAAGQAQLAFFATPVGQGGKTYSDTNMNLAGQLSAGNQFVVQAIEIETIAGLSSAATFTAGALPSVLAAPAAVTATNDVYKVRTTGNLQLTVLAKPYLIEGPLYKFPSSTVFETVGAQSDSTTAGAAQNVRTNSNFIRGKRYNISPLLLDQNVSFGITLNWPEGVIVITTAMKIYVRLCGILYRNVQ